jgi:predicted GIY-YIG superfamily endonuclease
MRDYSKSKIYKIGIKELEFFYIGSTTKTRLSQRLAEHKNAFNKWVLKNEGVFVFALIYF